MLKNKFKIIAILTLLILALTLPIVRAENETTDGEATPTTESTTDPTSDPANTTTTTVSDDNFRKGDVYLNGNDVTIDYIVDGNLFVVANHVTINSQIGGDAFICANTVTIGEQGYVFSNLFTFSKNLTINGVVYDLYAACQNTTINGYVYRDVRAGSDTVNIFGTIGRNAYVDCNTLNFTKSDNGSETDATMASQAMINGNLEYSANKEASIPEGIVSGETKFEPQSSFTSGTIQNYLISLGTFVITVIAIWLLGLWLAPKFFKNTTSLITTKKVLPVIGFGILVPIVGIFLAILFFILGITSTLGLLLLMLIFTLIAISTSIFIITINTLICNKLKIEKKIAVFGMLVALSIVLWLIGLIPFIGSILGIIVVILGLGMVVSSLVLKEKTATEEK